MNSLLARQTDQGIPLPAPFVFEPSGTFDGNDGPWSTFIINVGATDDGTSGQDFKILISTSASVIYVPIQASWCSRPDREKCARNRGIQTFRGRQSFGLQTDQISKWTQEGLYSLDVAFNLDYGIEDSPNGTYGFTTVGLGASSPQSPMLASQPVAGIATRNFFLGLFGLSIVPTQFGGGGIQTFLKTLNDSRNLIPSLSYGFTAGARYRNKGVLSNLVIGGYDRTRFRNPTTMAMPGQGNSSLVVGVKSITVKPDPNIDSNEYSMTAGSDGFLATIDSTLPYLWLPRPICDQFEKRFGLQYDEITELYTIRTFDHIRNLDLNSTITFTIGNDLSGSANSTSIVLPYSAFDQEAGFPFYLNATKYFPIKRSSTGIYILGRAFLQEAYIIVDFERNNFLVGQAVFPDPLPPPQIAAIPPVFSPQDSPLDVGSKLSTGAIIGISLSTAFLVFLAMAIGFFVLRRRRKCATVAARNEGVDSGSDRQPKKMTDKRVYVSELDSSHIGSPPSLSSTLFEVPDYRDPRVAGFDAIPEMESPPPVWELESPPMEAVIGSNKSTPSRQEIGEYFDDRQRNSASHHRQNSSISVLGLNLGTPLTPQLYELPGEPSDRAVPPVAGNNLASLEASIVQTNFVQNESSESAASGDNAREVSNLSDNSEGHGTIQDGKSDELKLGQVTVDQEAQERQKVLHKI